MVGKIRNMEKHKCECHKTLSKLEAALTKYNNKNIDLVNQYIKAEDNTLKSCCLSEEYNKNVFEIKKLNRRITLLKNQCPCGL